MTKHNILLIIILLIILILSLNCLSLSSANYGWFLLNNNEIYKAIHHFKLALEYEKKYEKEKHSGAYLGLIRSYISLKDYDTAEKFLNEGLSNFPDDKFLNFQAGIFYREVNKQYTLAIEYFEKSKQLFENNPDIVEDINNEIAHANYYLKNSIDFSNSFSVPTIVELNDSVDENIINGYAYDLSTLQIGKEIQSIKVPINALEIIYYEGDTLYIYSKKILAYYGHPPGKMTPFDAREYMGFAYKITDQTIEIATYGEWDSQIEGSAYILFKLKIPNRLKIIKTRLLSGEESSASSQDFSLYNKNDEHYWFTNTKPALGWLKIKSIPFKFIDELNW